MTDATLGFMIVTADTGAVLFAVVIMAVAVIVMIMTVIAALAVIMLMAAAAAVFMIVNVFAHNYLSSCTPGAAGDFFGSGLSFSHKVLLPGASMNLSL